MENEMKLAMGKILGETFRIQKNMGIVQVSDKTIFGLLNGFQEEIESHFDELQTISRRQVSVVCDALDPYYKDEKPLDEMPNFSTFRMGLERHGVSHSQLLDIFKYLKGSNSYVREIDRLGNFGFNDLEI